MSQSPLERAARRPRRGADLSALPPVHDRRKELIGVLGTRPVLPCYFEIEPHARFLELSVDEIRILLTTDFDECA